MMRVTTRSRYALHALLELANSHGGGPTYLSELCKAAGTSQKYLERIFARLKGAGIVQSSRGRSGGYELAKPPEEVYLIDVWRALEGPVLPLECLADPQSCPKSARCVPQSFWARVASAVADVLERTTLADLAEQAGTELDTAGGAEG